MVNKTSTDTTSSPKRGAEAVGYCRVSLKDQSTYSLQYQEKHVRDYCVIHNLNLLTIFTDDGESSYTFDRPDWNRLEQFIKQNKTVTHLIIFDHDRFSRNLAEALMKIKELQDKYGIKVLATTDSIDTDFSDPSTFMLRAFKYMVAESELHRIRQRTKAGMIQAAQSGRYIGMAPWGYINGKDSMGKPLLVIDNDKRLVIEMIFREYNRGSTLEEVRTMAKGYGYTQSGNSAIRRVLSNPAYAGMVHVPAHRNNPSQLVKGLHQAIVSEGEYWQAQTRLNQKAISQQSRDDVPLRGALKCHCGRIMTAGNSRSKSGNYYWYYVCSAHRQVNLSARKLHDQFNQILDLLSFDAPTLQWFTEQLSQMITVHINERGELQAKTIKSLRTVQDKILNAERRYLEGDVSKTVFNNVITQLRTEEGMLQRKLSELNTDASVYTDRLNILLPKLYDLRGTYEALPLVAKQQFVGMVFNNSLSYQDNCYRTQYLHPMFGHNELILSQQKLLLLDAKVYELHESPKSSPLGNGIEQFMRLSNILAA